MARLAVVEPNLRGATTLEFEPALLADLKHPLTAAGVGQTTVLRLLDRDGGVDRDALRAHVSAALDQVKRSGAMLDDVRS